ncbi:hypothetical protein AX16_010391 [Volvariella volvacea WC 439]|nr:hypothetical protein AX16_010391 [Volvariella volvacea WC 439]
MATHTREAFPIDAAQLVGLFMESIFYGTVLCIFLVTFFSCIRVLIHPENTFKQLHEINWKMMIAAILMFIFGTMDVAFGLVRNFDAFIHFDGDPIDEFSNTDNWVNVMKMACYVAQTFVGDAILLYRCWVVYNRRYLIVLLPTLVWIAGTVSGAMTIWAEATLSNNNADSLLNASKIVPFITSMLSLTLAVNVIVTSMIVWRIHSVRRPLKHRSVLSMDDGPLANVLRVLIESGLMYTISIVILFILYMANNNGQFGVSNAVVQIIGITFNLIITRVDRGRATQVSSNYRSQNGFVTNPVFSPGGPHGVTSGNAVPLHMINIHTTVSRYPADDPDPTIGEGKVARSEDEDSDLRENEEKRKTRVTGAHAV